MTTATNPATDFDYFDAGNDINDQNWFAQKRVMQHMNETPLHTKTEIARGGYGIKDVAGDAPEIGPSQEIKHRGDRSTQMRVAKMAEVAVIAASPLYFVCEWDSLTEVGRRDRLISARYVKPQDMPGTNGKCRSGISFFVVLKCDPKREVYEIPFRGFVTDEAKKLIGELRDINTRLGEEIKKSTGKPVKVLSFAHWMPLGVVDDSVMVGSVEKSMVTPPQWRTDKAQPERVSKEDYLAFIELRREIDEYMAAQPYMVKTGPQLAPPAQNPALTGPATEDEDFNG